MNRDPLEDNTVDDYILENEPNLDIALRIARAFPPLQKRLIVETLDALEEKLGPSLDSNWGIYNCRDEIGAKSYPGFNIFKKSWKGCCINLESQWHEGGAVVGVWREKNIVDRATMDVLLVEAFNKKNLTGEANSHWAWFQGLPPEKGDWSSAPTLAAMHFKRNELVEYLIKQIQLVRSVAEPVLDKFFAKK